MKTLFLLLICSISSCFAISTGGFTATLGNVQGNGCNGPSNVGFAQGANVSNFWMTQATINGRVTGMISLGGAPGSGKTCSFKLQYASISSTQSCSDLSSFTELELGTISGATQKNLQFSGTVSMSGVTCGRVYTTCPTANCSAISAGGVFSMFWNGPANFAMAGTGTVGATSTTYMGQLGADSNQTIDRGFWITPVAISAIGGAISAGAPGSGVTWTPKIGYSAPLSTQSCGDTTTTQVSTGATITGTSQKSTSWAPVAVSIAAGSCVRLEFISSGGTPATFAGSAGLDITFANGPGIYMGSAGSGAFNGTHTFGAAPWAISDINTSTLEQEYWPGPPEGLYACGGGFTFTSAVGGSGQFNIGLTASTTTPTSSQGAYDLTYNNSASQCTAGQGAKSCFFTPTAFYVPPNGYVALNVTSSGGSPTMSGNFNWDVVCIPLLPGGVSGSAGAN